MTNNKTHRKPTKKVFQSMEKDLGGSGIMNPSEGPTDPAANSSNPLCRLNRRSGGSQVQEGDELPSRIRGHLQHLVSVVNGLRMHSSGRKEFNLETPFRRLKRIDRKVPFEKVIKWFYASSLSIVTGDTVPPCPDVVLEETILSLSPDTMWTVPKKLFGGSLGKQIAFLFRRAYYKVKSGSDLQEEKGLSVGQTFLLAKKGTPVVSASLKEEAKRKHRKALSDRQKGLHARLRDNVVVNDCIEDDRVLGEITRTVQEIFGNHQFKEREGIAPFPSVSGHFKSTSQDAGAAAVICRAWKASQGEPGAGDYGRSHSARISVEVEEGLLDFEHFKGQNERFYLAMERSLELERQAGYPVLPVQILEPLKVRTVTCGPEWSYWAMIDLQKFMWKVLKDHPTFSLIGKPIDSEVLQDLIRLRHRGANFLSGDYSAATDNLRKVFSDHCWSEICRITGVPVWLHQLGLSCLTGHTIYESRDGSISGQTSQDNGQLMGSPLSFPILCIINAVICRMAFSPSRSGRRLKRLPIRINGDDCGMAYTEEEKKEWERISAWVGLEPSPGKCYFSARFIQLNSVLFALRDGVWKRIPFFNFGLTKPRSSKGDKIRDVTSIGDLAREFIFTAYPDGFVEDKELLWKLRGRATRYFINCQKELLESIPAPGKGVDWFLSKQYGGLGIPARNSFVAKRLSHDNRVLLSFLHTQMLKGDAPDSPFGRWTTDMHPWLNKALQETARYETKRVVFEDEFPELDPYAPDVCWADLAEDDTPWGVFKRLDVFAPVLWDYSARVTFDSCLTEKGKKVKGKGKGKEAHIFTKWRSTLRKALKWNEKLLAAGETNHLFGLEDCSRPRHIETIIHEKTLDVLKACVSAPRNFTSSLSDPTRRGDFTVTTNVLTMISPFSNLEL